MKSFLIVILLALVVVSLGAALPRKGWDWCLFGFIGTTCNTAPAGASITTTTVPATALTFNTRHVIRWTDNSGGPIDALIVEDSMAGQPKQRQTLGSATARPTSGLTVMFTWPNPPLGTTVQGIVRAQTQRRAKSSAWAQKGWSRTEADTDPPVPVIDTTMQIGAIRLKPDSVGFRYDATRRIFVDALGNPSPGTQQFCTYLSFKNRKVANDPTAPIVCISQYPSYFTSTERNVTARQQARADSIYQGFLVLREANRVEPKNPAHSQEPLRVAFFSGRVPGYVLGFSEQ